MKQVFLDIKALLESKITQAALAAIGIVTEAPFITVMLFENQFKRMAEGEQIPFPLPAVIISFSGPNEWKQLGTGVQMLDPFIINAHICMEFYDASTDNVSVAAGVINDQNLPIFDLKQLVYKTMQYFEPTNTAMLVRFEDTLDEDTKEFYHWLQRYRSNLIDTDAQQPQGGIMSAPPYTMDLTLNRTIP